MQWREVRSHGYILGLNKKDLLGLSGPVEKIAHVSAQLGLAEQILLKPGTSDKRASLGR